MSEVLVESMSPHGGGVAASVEDHGQSVHLYLHGLPGGRAPVRSVWVANRVAAPEVLNEKTWPRGTAPRQPRAHCVDAAGSPPLHAESLSLVWLPGEDSLPIILSSQLPMQSSLAVELADVEGIGRRCVTRAVHGRGAGRDPVAATARRRVMAEADRAAAHR